MKELEAEHTADFKAFLRMEPQMYYELLNSIGARPVSFKNTSLVLWYSQMHGTPADTRPYTGRRVFRCGNDGAAMRELGKSPMKFSSEVKISPSCHRCGFKKQMPLMSGRCPAGVRPSLVRIASLAHRNLIDRAM